jgi:hypothetical protein
MRNKDKQKKYAFSSDGKGEDKPKTGPRQVVLLLGGTGEGVGREILADEELMAEDHLRAGLSESRYSAADGVKSLEGAGSEIVKGVRDETEVVQSD